MKYVRSFLCALGMFTVIPMPQYDWDMAHGSRMTACFGFAGALLGLLYLLLAKLLLLLSIPALIFTVFMVAAVYLLTGFLHLDGFMDVCDALLSHRDEAGRRRILKDPHCGSFSVISLVLVLAANLASVHVLRTASSFAFMAAPIVCIPALARSLSGLLLLCVKTMPDSSLGAYFKTGSGPAVISVLAATGLAAFAAVWYFSGVSCAAALLAGMVPGVAAGLYAARRLGGINGDVSGFTVVLCETAMLLALTFLF